MQRVREWVSIICEPSSRARTAFLAGCAILGVLLAAVGAYALAGDFMDLPAYPDGTDLSLYLRAADALPGNPYAADVNHGFDRYGYPPLLAVVLAGLKFIVGPVLILWIWPMLCGAALAGAIVFLSRGFGIKLPWQVIVLLCGAAFLGHVFRADILHGQVNIFILLALAGGIYLRSQGWVVAAALVFAVMMSLKPFMGAVAIFFLLRRDWRMAAWTLGLGALVFFLSFAPMGAGAVDAFTGWREATQHFTSPPFATKPDNQSIVGMALRLFTPTDHGVPLVDNPALVPVVVGAAAIVAAALGAIGMFAHRRMESPAVQDRAELLLECSMIVALFMACSPLTEGDHMIITLGGLAAVLIVGARRLRARAATGRWWIAAMVAWALPSIVLFSPRQLPFIYDTWDHWFGIDGAEILLTGRSFYLLMLAGGLTAVALWQDRRHKPSAV
jgi:hypothetical protein